MTSSTAPTQCPAPLPPISLDCISAGAGAISFDGVAEGEIGTGTTPEYNAAAGYNLATGLGTIDASNLVNDWNKVTLLSTATTMTASQTSFAHGTAITISGAVTGTGTPTGNVALETDSTEPVNQGQAVFPLTSGAYTNAAVNYLPGGTYHIWGQYGGDSKNGMSTSTPPIQITVTPETPGIALHLFNTLARRVLPLHRFQPRNPGGLRDPTHDQRPGGSGIDISSPLQSCEIPGTTAAAWAHLPRRLATSRSLTTEIRLTPP